MKLLSIFIGAGLGALLRYGIATQLYSRIESAFPWGTFTVNVLGCFLIGVLWAWLKTGEHPYYYLLATGFLGGFTTFSAFGLESMVLWQKGHYQVLVAYVLLSNIAGLAAVYGGNMLTRHLI